MLAGVLFGLAAAIAVTAIAANFLMIARNYRELPESVPYHFDAYGNPDQFGPRPLVFIGPFGLLIAFAILIALIVNGGTDSMAAVCIVGGIVDFVAIAGYFMQRGILNVALGKVETMHPYAFWRN